jgi:hypothetical protein
MTKKFGNKKHKAGSMPALCFYANRFAYVRASVV